MDIKKGILYVQFSRLSDDIARISDESARL